MPRQQMILRLRVERGHAPSCGSGVAEADDPVFGMLEFIRRLRREAGQATAEFALILPVLIAVTLGIVDFGKAFNYWIDATHMANAAARAAAVNALPGTTGSPCAGQAASSTIAYQVSRQADTSELRCGGGSVQSIAGCSDGTVTFRGVCITFCFPAFQTGGTLGPVGQPVKAQAVVKYNWLKFLTSPLGIAGLTNVTITSSATMRIESKYDGSTYTVNAGTPTAC